jgi:integrase
MRTRHQAGSVQDVSGGKKRKWALKYWDADGHRRFHTLKAKTKSGAQSEATEFLAPVNRERQSRQKGVEMMLAAYTEHVYVPFGLRKWKGSTAITTVQRIRQHIIGGELGSVAISKLDRETMQSFLDKRGLSSRSLVNHLRFDLQAICRLAVADGLMPRNQAEALYTPRSCEMPSQPVMTAEQVMQAMTVLDIRERAFCRLAIFAGMRPGEIIALRWSDIQDGMALVDDRIYKGEQGTTKNSKARGVSLSPAVVRDLETWRNSATASEYVFASENPASPVKYENLWQRSIKPRFSKIGLAWADFRCMRRTNSTLMKAAGADVKVSADQRGHGVNVSLAEYTHSTDGQKAEAVRQLERLIQ